MNVAITIQLPGSPCPIERTNKDTTVFTKKQPDPTSQTNVESDRRSLFFLLETKTNTLYIKRKSLEEERPKQL